MSKYTAASTYPWRDALENYRKLAEEAGPAPSDGWNQARKLALVESVVRAYTPYQDSSGAIIDPFSEAERYYSTPAYAMAASVLVQAGHMDLLASAASALSHSIDVVVKRCAPDHHPDFFPVLMMRAYILLKPHVPEQAKVWAEALKKIQPEQDYVFTMSKMNNPNRMINWNAIMISGEYLRLREQLASEGTDWMDRYLNRYHLPRFTPLGLYQDGPLDHPNCPFSYDIATRYHLDVMLEAGYDGACAGELKKHLRHGAFSTLLTLSPLGEIPPRGRSSQHQWNEAAAAYVCSVHAAQALQAGDRVMAGAFARAANRCFEAVERWKMEDGRLKIVRNEYAPEARHGYEIYTNHTGYNLWTAAALAHACLSAPAEDVTEIYLPSEIGNRVLQADGWFETIIASVPGQQMILHTAMNDPYTVPGLVRIQQAGLPGLIGPSAAGHVQTGFTEFAEGEVGPLSYCPVWKTADGNWHSLAGGIPSGADYDRDAGINPGDGGGSILLETVDREVRNDSASLGRDDGKHQDQANAFTVTWLGPLTGLDSLQTHYVQQADLLTVTYEFDGELEAVGALIPLMFSDGREQADITHSKQAVRSEYREAYVESNVLDEGATIHLKEQPVASRNGLLKEARMEVSEGRSITFTIRLGMN
ncbi:glycosyl hydrolase [Paenibacillus taichungensis]|uniref:Glycosyl hydrolase n=1 Tax=Paenibacillus taichungensis TaxID=484184 RepID=A0A329QNW4_9BACL|nr:glycosyl hydrolase [Paenibacillus taichungensis]RAW12318.1 glycosyl hydrolase [Paenibacillus taichungensis]